MPLSRLEKIMNSASRVMQQEFETTATIKHPGGKGSAREVILQRFLEKYIPRSNEVVANGEIVNSFGAVSNECDILILDGKTRPLLIEYGYHVVTAESTLGIIEVKSKLSRDELRSSFGKLLQAKIMERYVPLSEWWRILPDGTRIEAGKIPFIYIFAYESISIEEIFSELVALQQDAPSLAYCIDGVWILSQGFIKWTDLGVLKVGVGDRFPTNPHVAHDFSSGSADLVLVKTGESSPLLPLVADLNYRLNETPMGMHPYFKDGNWGIISRSAKFSFAEPGQIIWAES